MTLGKDETVPEEGAAVDVPLDSKIRDQDARAKRIVTISFISAGVFFLAIALGLVTWLMSASSSAVSAVTTAL